MRPSSADRAAGGRSMASRCRTGPLGTGGPSGAHPVPCPRSAAFERRPPLSGRPPRGLCLVRVPRRLLPLLPALPLWALLLFPAAAPGESGADLLRRPAARELGRNLYDFAPGDTIEIVARRELRPGPARIGAAVPATFTTTELRRPVSPERLLQPRTVALSRFACAIYGADLGAGAASALGGLGLVSGLMGEKSAAWLMGVGAVAGALWGGTAGANDSGFRIRVEAPDPDRGADRRSRRIDEIDRRSR